MNILDVLIVTVGLGAIYRGYKRGGTQELLSLCAFLVGFFVSFGAGAKLYGGLSSYLSARGLPAYEGYFIFLVVLIFVLMGFMLRWVGGFFQLTLRAVGAASLEHLLGAVLAPVRYLFWISFLAGLLEMSGTKWLGRTRKESSCYHFSHSLFEKGKKWADGKKQARDAY